MPEKLTVFPNWEGGSYEKECFIYDDNDEKSPWKLDEVLEEICKFSGLTFYTDSSNGFFIDK